MRPLWRIFRCSSGAPNSGKTYKERPSVYGLCTRNDEKIALVKVGGSQNFHFDLPGGGVESGESDAEAVVRELDEETGLDRLARPPIMPGWAILDQ